MMIGTVDHARRPRTTSMPSMPGRPRSRSTTSGWVCGGEPQRLLAGGGQVDVVAAGPQVHLEGAPDLRLVVDDQHAGHERRTNRLDARTSGCGAAASARTRRQVDEDGEPPAGRVVEQDLAAHGLDEPAGDGQAEADAGLAAAVAEALERLEDAVAVGRGHARATVDDPQVDPVRRPRRPRSAPGSPGGDQAQGVGDDVGQRPLEQGGSASTGGQLSGTSTVDLVGLVVDRG